MTGDLLERLRATAAKKLCGHEEITEAVGEIERLRGENEKQLSMLRYLGIVLRERNEATAEIERLRGELSKRAAA